MRPEVSVPVHSAPPRPWLVAGTRLALAWAALIAVNLSEWREMAHQWWDIDTYAHILMVPPILGWLAWSRRKELQAIVPYAWTPGLGLIAGALAIVLIGRAAEVNLVAGVGAVLALQGAVVTLLGLRAALVLAFPLAYAFFLVPFGDEIVAPLQQVTARLAVALTHASGVEAALHGLFIDTPAGRFVVAEECSGVKFLIAMVALATLVGGTAFERWTRRAMFILGAATVSVAANGVRAWGTIYAAQFVGVERAGGIDHVIYGWVFFAVIVIVLLGAARMLTERDPRDAGLSAAAADGIARRIGGATMGSDAASVMILFIAASFAVCATLV